MIGPQSKYGSYNLHVDDPWALQQESLVEDL